MKTNVSLVLSWRTPLSYRNQSNDLLCFYMIGASMMKELTSLHGDANSSFILMVRSSSILKDSKINEKTSLDSFYSKAEGCITVTLLKVCMTDASLGTFRNISKQVFCRLVDGCFPADIYWFKVYNGNIWTKYEISSKLHIVLVFLFLL